MDIHIYIYIKIYIYIYTRVYIYICVHVYVCVYKFWISLKPARDGLRHIRGVLYDCDIYVELRTTVLATIGPYGEEVVEGFR